MDFGSPVMFRALNSCFAKVTFPQRVHLQLRGKNLDSQIFFFLFTANHTVQLRTYRGEKWNAALHEADAFERYHKGKTEFEEPDACTASAPVCFAVIVRPEKPTASALGTRKHPVCFQVLKYMSGLKWGRQQH